MRPISSFLALNMQDHPVQVWEEDHQRLVTTWWRHSGLLSVGGAASIVNIWDCPAEQRVRVCACLLACICPADRQQLHTQETCALTTLITEPRSGNLLVGGMANGKVKFFDLRQTRHTCVLEYDGGTIQANDSPMQRGIKKVGILLGESAHITSARWALTC